MNAIIHFDMKKYMKINKKMGMSLARAIAIILQE